MGNKYLARTTGIYSGVNFRPVARNSFLLPVNPSTHFLEIGSRIASHVRCHINSNQNTNAPAIKGTCNRAHMDTYSRKINSLLSVQCTFNVSAIYNIASVLNAKLMNSLITKKITRDDLESTGSNLTFFVTKFDGLKYEILQIYTL